MSAVNRLFLDGLCEAARASTKVSRSTDYDARGEPTERLVDLCRAQARRRYLSGPAARDYLDEEPFAEAGIEVEYMDYSGYPEYPQLHPPFEHAVTVLDLLFNTGASAPAS